MRKIRCGQLSSGLKYYTQYESSGSANLCGIGVKVGSMYDAPFARSIAHLSEHASFRESKKYSVEEIYRMVYKFTGGLDGLNVWVNRTSTFFGSPDLYSRKDLRTIFDVIANVVKDRLITLAGVEIEKSAIHQEYHLTGDDCMPDVIENLFYQALYEKNPARFPMGGEIADLKNISANKVRQLIRRYYVPKNMFVLMLGPSFAEATGLVKTYFDGWGAKTTPIIDVDRSEIFPVLTDIRSVEIERAGIHQYFLALGFPTETYLSNDSEAIDLLARLLNFRLIMRLREGNRNFSQGVYRASVVAERTFNHGAFYTWIATTSKEYIKHAEAVIIEEVRRLRKELISPRDLDDFTRSMLLDYMNAFRSSADMLSDLIIEAVSNGDENLEHLHNYKNRVNSLTRRKIRKVANKYFTDNYARAVIRPTEPISTGD